MSGHDKIVKLANSFADLEGEDIIIPSDAADNLKGIAGDRSLEKQEEQVIFNKLANEKVISNPDNGAHIVLGRDRSGGAFSNTTGLPKTNSIDIVVGRLSKISEQISKQTKKEKKWITPSFLDDAARIHISQFTNIDENFLLPNGTIGKSKEESGIGIKADSIRIMSGTGGIKLVAATDKRSSSGIKKEKAKGIDLICGIPYDPKNENINKQYERRRHIHDMQAIPKTENLKEALNFLIDCTDTITGLLLEFGHMQLQFNDFLVNHTHIETFNGNQGIPSKDLYGPYLEMNMEFFEKTLKQVQQFKAVTIPKFKRTYTSTTSDLYIGSRFHSLN